MGCGASSGSVVATSTTASRPFSFAAADKAHRDSKAARLSETLDPDAVVAFSCGPEARSSGSRITKNAGPEGPPKKLLAIREAFDAIDTNKSGNINASELKDLLDSVGPDDLTDTDRDEILKSMDKDNGGMVEFREFAEWVLEKEDANDAIASWSLTKGLSELHTAAIEGNEASIRRLLDDGQKVNIGDVGGVTPLHYACRVGSGPAAAALLEKKADVAARTSDTKRMPLHAAAEKGCTDLVELLLAANADINAKDGRDRTPLHWACCSSREAAAAALLKAGAEVNGKSIAGYTPFAMAQDWSTMSMADLVQSYGGER